MSESKPAVANLTEFESTTRELPDLATAEAMLTAAIGQIHWAREYTQSLLNETPRELWFERPQISTTATPGESLPLCSHIAWQVGHLAVSQYGLLMFRIHGRRDDDLELVPGRFRKAFSRGSDPAIVSSSQWSADELVERLERIHAASLAGLTDGLDTRVLLESVEMPYAAYPIKLGAILFCPLHEHIHSGQIGVIRRCLGLAPVR